MNKKTKIRTVIRQIVREEVAMAIGEVVSELKQPSLSSKPVSQPKPKKKIIEKKTFTKDSILNDILNETAQGDEWKTMGEGTYDSNRMSEIMNGDPNAPVSVDGKTPDFLKKDYRSLMKAVDKKVEQKRGV